MEFTVTGSLRQASDVLREALVSLEDSGMYPPCSEMNDLYRESEEIRIDFAHAHLRQGKYLASRNLEFTEIFSQETGESFAEQVNECLKLIRNSPSPTHKGVPGGGSPDEDAAEACISQVEGLLDEIARLVENEYLVEELWRHHAGLS